jgi:hypothetical protein
MPVPVNKEFQPERADDVLDQEGEGGDLPAGPGSGRRSHQVSRLDGPIKAGRRVCQPEESVLVR